MTAQDTFTAAARAFTGLVETVPADRLSAPGLGEWTVRDLIGHTVSAGLAAVADGLGRPAATEDLTTPESYYALARTAGPDVLEAAVAASAADAGAWGARLGERPADHVRPLADRAVAAVAAAGPDALVTTAGGGMRLACWLPTRTFELVVHGMDVANATGARLGLPVDVLAEAAGLAARLAAVTGDGRRVLLALTGRSGLPEGFSVV
ncbi:TIGR03083 family protein [Lentzea fradiae]|uniref:TIGR03083 family protein n=1 Tax=Lentzea fradiae TaxID=200378 RepID=A0A1G7MZG5_9PSEU|nr:maleylpyruvate isomerase family mycothiol-dependent enzyme [Lentzea fradiae]SDF67198.1 TIGR03083 family protein [Lentzea fradiae]